jgi:glycosyltransferase EpsD
LNAGDDFCVGFIASFSLEKQHWVAVQALAQAKKSCRRIRLFLTGTGPTMEEVKDLARSLGVENDCEFLGFRPDIPEILPGFDVTLNCSRREGCCNAIIESMASRVPVVASAVGGNGEIVAPYERGLLFQDSNYQELGDLLARCCRGEFDLGLWGRNGQEYANRTFEISARVGEMERLFKCLAEAPSRKRFGRGRVVTQ